MATFAEIITKAVLGQLAKHCVQPNASAVFTYADRNRRSVNTIARIILQRKVELHHASDSLWQVDNTT
jgi:hypothetical protein